MSGYLESIVSLQATLNELTAAELRLNSIPDWMSELHAEHSAKQAEIDEVAAAGAEADRLRREAEAATSDAEEKLKHFQDQIGKVTTQREYGALLKEIDNAKSMKSAGEQNELEAIEQKELADEQQRELREGFRDLDERYQGELGKWESEKPSVEQAVRELTSRSEELRGALPKPISTLFDRIRERLGGQALARVHKIRMPRGNAMWHCAACNFNVRPQVVVEIRNDGALTQCDSCKRILYWEPEDGE